MNKPRKVKCEACTEAGICGKSEDVAALQDLLTYALTGLSLVTLEGGRLASLIAILMCLFCISFFAASTNVNFDPERSITLFRQYVQYRNALLIKVKGVGGNTSFVNDSDVFKPAGTTDKLVA